MLAPVRLWPKNPASKPIELRVVKILAQVPSQDRPDVAHVARDQNPHSQLPRFAHHSFQGALPDAHRSSRCRLSLSVSIGCQKPRWK